MTPEGQETATTPAIPAPRAPLDPPLRVANPPVVPPEETTVDRRPWRRIGVFGLLIVVTAAGVLLWGFRKGGEPEAAAEAATSAAPASSATLTPDGQAVQTLDAQAAALLRGDEGGWLAAVDPSRSALRTHYRNVFRSLRALGVTRFEYRFDPALPVKGQTTARVMHVRVSYCFSPQMCPTDDSRPGADPPTIGEKLTLRPVGGRYVISARQAAPGAGTHQPVPWEDGRLVFAQGKRVVVAAPPGQAKYLSRVLPLAEKAAAVNDRYAALTGARQGRYRIFLTGAKQWKTWYGGEDEKWVIALAVPLNFYGTDVVVSTAAFHDPIDLRVTLQHELGHVVTLTGAAQEDADAHTWLSEGVAEYIGWQPKSATGSLRRDSVRWQLARKTLKSMVPTMPGPKASDRAGDAFYGLSHFAVSCMAKKYGERKLFNFVRLVLVEDKTNDQAAKAAYGASFATVNKYCVRWIRQQA